MTWKRSLRACLWGVVLIILIMMRRPILIIGGTFSWMGDSRLYKSEDSQPSTSIMHSWFLSSGFRHSVIICFQLPLPWLLTWWTVLLNCEPGRPFLPWVAFAKDFMTAVRQATNHPAYSRVLKMLGPLFCFIVYVPVSHQHQTARSAQLTKQVSMSFSMLLLALFYKIVLGMCFFICI